MSRRMSRKRTCSLDVDSIPPAPEPVMVAPRTAEEVLSMVVTHDPVAEFLAHQAQVQVGQVQVEQVPLLAPGAPAPVVTLTREELLEKYPEPERLRGLTLAMVEGGRFLVLEGDIDMTGAEVLTPMRFGKNYGESLSAATARIMAAMRANMKKGR